MGKHCNVILLDEQNIIIDSLRHINSENSTRAIVPHVKYTYPATTKTNFLDCTSFETFYEKLSLGKPIYEVFNGISKSFLDASLVNLGITNLDKSNSEKLYNYLQKIINNTDSNLLDFEIIENKKKDYFLKPTTNASAPFHLNFFLDDFYNIKETSEYFKIYRDSILKMILEVLNKYKKRLYNMEEKLQTCEDMEKYQLYGELITANLYQIPNENLKEITLDNYYTGNY